MELSEKKLSDMLEQIPTFSQSVLRILELTGDVNCSTKELVNQIAHDPILTVKVLKLVNSAFFGLSREVTSIQQSVVYIGINTIKNLAISVAAMGALPKTNKAGLDMLHSLLTAVVAKQLAQKRRVPNTEVSSYFISGLLHDIGQIIFSQAQPEIYQEVINEAKLLEDPLHIIEQKAFNINHAEIGARLAEKWQLPTTMVQAIRNHHSPRQMSGDQDMDKSIFVANQVAKLLAKELLAKELLAKELLAKELLAKELLAKELLAKEILAKEILAKEILAKELLATDTPDETSLEEGKSPITSMEDVPVNIQGWLKIPIDQVADSLENLQAEVENAKLFIQMTD